MAFSCDDEDGEPPLTRSVAEINLKHLLDRQLSATTRLEQVEFQQATESMHSLVHANCGISTLQEFVKAESAQKQLLEKTRRLQNVLDGMGYSKEKIQERCQRISSSDIAGTSSLKVTKRQRYGADPAFLLHSEAEDRQIASLECELKLKEDISSSFNQIVSSQSKVVDASLLTGKEGLRAISHLSAAAISCRKPLFGVGEIGEQLTMTPQDRARQGAGTDNSRLTNEVFSRPAPQVLDLHAYLKQRSECEPGCGDSISPQENVGQCEQLSNSHAKDGHNSVLKVPESEILNNRLSQEEIRQLPCGKFTNYSPGNPSRVLYLKNLAKDVTEVDLVALFIRYQDRNEPLLFRLMKRGRMKGQAFVTFADKEISSKALQLLNGYKLKGKPMVIEFGRGNHGSCCAPCNEFDK